VPGSAEARAHAWIRTELQAALGADPALAARLITRHAAGREDRPSGCHLSVHDDLDAILACPADLRACYQLRRPGRLPAALTTFVMSVLTQLTEIEATEQSLARWVSLTGELRSKPEE
jgi:hypothetical protein